MKDLIVFTAGSNKYALDIENIQRIIQADTLTNIPNSHELIDGMMSYETSILKILSFRKLIDLPSYDDDLRELFANLKVAHEEWVEALKISISTGSEFTKTTNPHMCELGKWIDNFTSYDDRVTFVLSNLVKYHRILHIRGGEACEIRNENAEEAQKIMDIEINDIYHKTMGALDTFTDEIDNVANSLQKLLIYESDGKRFAIKVDTIEDIAHIEDSQIKNSEESIENNCLQLDGVLDLDGDLINIIKSIQMPA